jgi:1-deoxy-D-xylulose-5-phosphate reductoisomerase
LVENIYELNVKRLTILGSTGSIGVNALQVVSKAPDKFKVQYLTAKKNAELLISQACQYHPRAVAIKDLSQVNKVAAALKSQGIEVLAGEEGIRSICQAADVDLVLNAIVGSAGLLPTYYALQAGKNLALANKESLVMAGEIITALCQRQKLTILPVDSEHSAIFQCLVGEEHRTIKTLYITGSGGPFRELPLDQFDEITPAAALRHPTWNMGQKITIDSATLMNKGLEMIEAHWLFKIPAAAIKVILHPQSIVHSLVEFCDGSVKAQLGLPDMRLPIQYALNYPDRLPVIWGTLDLVAVQQLTFEEPDSVRFPAIKLAYQALQQGGTAPAILNVVNELAVMAFLAGKIKFRQITALVAEALNKMDIKTNPNLDDILAAESEAHTFFNRSLNR